MASELNLFGVNRWHSPEYVESWAADRVRTAEQRPLRKNWFHFFHLSSQWPSESWI